MAVATGKAGKARRLGSERLREGAIGYAFVAIPLGIFASSTIYPMVYAFYVVHEWGGLEGNLGYIGLDNFRDLKADEQFWTWPPNAGPRSGTRSTSRSSSSRCR